MIFPSVFLGAIEQGADELDMELDEMLPEIDLLQVFHNRGHEPAY